MQVTLIYGKDLPVEHPDLPARGMILCPDVTRYHADRCQSWHAELGYVAEPLTEAGLSLWGNTDAERHVRGLLDISLKLRDRGVLFTWRFPETFLHPRYQVELGDVVLRLRLNGARHG